MHPLKQSQVAVGFVLTMSAAILSYFLGNPYMNDRTETFILVDTRIV
jgi:hypothetical protein